MAKRVTAESEIENEGCDYDVGTHEYDDTALVTALDADASVAKAIFTLTLSISHPGLCPCSSLVIATTSRRYSMRNIHVILKKKLEFKGLTQRYRLGSCDIQERVD